MKFMKKMLDSKDRGSPQIDSIPFEEIPSSVIHLRQDNFKQSLENVPSALVMYHVTIQYLVLHPVMFNL